MSGLWQLHMQAKRADAEEQGRFNRKRRELARTPHPMLLTRISQLVASFEDLQHDMDTLHAMLDGDQNSSSRRKLGAAQPLKVALLLCDERSIYWLRIQSLLIRIWRWPCARSRLPHD